MFRISNDSQKFSKETLLSLMAFSTLLCVCENIKRKVALDISDEKFLVEGDEVKSWLVCPATASESLALFLIFRTSPPSLFLCTCKGKRLARSSVKEGQILGCKPNVIVFGSGFPCNSINAESGYSS